MKTSNIPNKRFFIVLISFFLFLEKLKNLKRKQKTKDKKRKRKRKREEFLISKWVPRGEGGTRGRGLLHFRLIALVFLHSVVGGESWVLNGKKKGNKREKKINK